VFFTDHMSGFDIKNDETEQEEIQKFVKECSKNAKNNPICRERHNLLENRKKTLEILKQNLQISTKYFFQATL